MNAPAPGWLPDPDARHEYRYWDGSGWTDDVADGGVTSTDPVSGGIPAPPPPPSLGGEPTAQIDSTQQFPTSPAPPSSQYPGPGTAGPGPDSGQGPGEYPPYPAPTPPKKRPSTGLIAGLAALAIALIGGGTWLLVRDDSDDSADDASEISDDSGDASNEDGTSEETDDTDDTDDTSGDDTSSDDGDDVLPDDLDLENEDAIAEMLATTIEQASGGQITHEQAVCVSQGFIDEFGLSEMIEQGASGELFTNPDAQAQMLDLFAGCDISPDVLDGTGTEG